MPGATVCPSPDYSHSTVRPVIPVPSRRWHTVSPIVSHYWGRYFDISIIFNAGFIVFPSYDHGFNWIMQLFGCSSSAYNRSRLETADIYLVRFVYIFFLYFFIVSKQSQTLCQPFNRSNSHLTVCEVKFCVNHSVGRVHI